MNVAMCTTVLIDLHCTSFISEHYNIRTANSYCIAVIF